MKLYIAEKPSLGRAIAAALPKPHKKHKTHIEVANGDIVSWCVGHVLAQADPQDYDANLKKWSMETLPIVPQQWQLKPIARTREQLSALRKLVKQADTIVHAGDPDREGQLLVDELIDYLKVSSSKKSTIKRLLINDLNVSAVKRSLKNLKNNQEFMPLSISALARSRADWLYGINLTRAYTLQGQKNGYHSVLSVGRVQTPVLGLVVRREQEIAKFVSKPFYQVLAHLTEQSQKTDEHKGFTANWQPSEACQQYCDDEGRVLVKRLAENVATRISAKMARVSEVNNEQKQQSQPLPFNLSNLQIAAAKQFSMNAKLVLDVCQALYEKHKLITYPRSDCRYLPAEQFNQAPDIIAMLKQSNLPCAQQAISADSSIKTKAWNSKKVTAHHAIIPTEKCANNISLNPFEKNVYSLIVRQYLAQFYPMHKFTDTKVSITIEGGLFKASTKHVQEQGWKVLFLSKTSSEKSDSNSLPELHQGQELYCHKGEVVEKHTTPPESFTDASLLSAMTGIARFVQDKEIKKILRDTDGLGTDATRAGIIDLLFKRGFLSRQGKKIIASETGVALINALPMQATLPDMTAQWEASLTAISHKSASYLSFMNPLISAVVDMVNGASEQQFSGLPKVAFKPKRKRKSFKKPTKKSSGAVA